MGGLLVIHPTSTHSQARGVFTQSPGFSPYALQSIEVQPLVKLVTIWMAIILIVLLPFCY